MKQFFSRTLPLLLGLTLLAVSLASCGAAADNAAADNANYYEASGYYGKGDYAYADVYEEAEYEVAYDAAMEAPMEAGSYKQVSEAVTSAAQSSPVTDDRKIIKTVSLTMETKDFDAAVTDIERVAESIGGYIENSYVGGSSYYNAGHASRYASFTLRVPADAVDQCVNTFGERYNVTSRSQGSQDITETYYDMSARMESLQIQQERLLEMLKTADSLEYVIQLEDKLSQIRYEIDSYQSSLKRYDNRVALSCVNIELQEVVEYQPIIETPKSFGERLSIAVTESWAGFVRGLKEFCIGFVYALPTLLVIAVIAIVVILIILALVRRHRRRAAARTASAVPVPTASAESGKTEKNE